MLRHLLKLVWKRKSRNMMLSLEILLAFLMVFGIAAFAVRNYELSRMPTGFAWRDQWAVRIGAAQSIPNDAVMYDKLKRGLLDLPEVEKVAFSTFPTYENWIWTGDYSLPDGSHRKEINILSVSDDYFAAMEMTPSEGRWFSSADDGADATPAVINRRLANRLFAGKSAVGREFIEPGPNDKPRRFRVSAVVEHFRQRGDYMDPADFMLPRFIPGVDNAAETIMLKLKPGTPRTFESKLNARLKQLHGDWSYSIVPLSESRESTLSGHMALLMPLSVIAAFTLVMVAFGLFGVLWQTTTQRIPEIGLRRALGADAGSIYRQIVAEQLLISTAAMGVAMMLVMQLPLTGVYGESLNWTVFLVSAALSAGVIYLLSLLCSLYPAWRAARLSPTQALHYE